MGNHLARQMLRQWTPPQLQHVGLNRSLRQRALPPRSDLAESADVVTPAAGPAHVSSSSSTFASFKSAVLKPSVNQS
jgi:hypothetical protein